jgi:hypothetical protein
MEKLKTNYPRLAQLGIPVKSMDYAPSRFLNYVLIADVKAGLKRHRLSKRLFDELFGVQTCPVTDEGPGLYPWDTEAVLERMLSGRLTGTQLVWD